MEPECREVTNQSCINLWKELFTKPGLFINDATTDFERIPGPAIELKSVREVQVLDKFSKALRRTV